MSKVNLPAIPGGYLSLGAMNTRFAAIEDAFDNTLSLDGSLPNSMEADLDMDSNDILNVGLIFVDDINIQGLTTGGILTEASEAAVAAGISAQEAEQSALDASANAEARRVDSVSELRTSTFPANIQRLWLMGYYGVGTAGGGPLYRDSGDTVSADNGGTVFVDEDGVRWKRAHMDEMSIGHFGAQAGDDIGPILNAMASEQIAKIFMPPGEYTSSEEAVFDYSVSLEGIAKETVVTLSGATGFFIAVEGSFGSSATVTVTGDVNSNILTLDDVSAFSKGDIVRVQDAEDTWVYDPDRNYRAGQISVITEVNSTDSQVTLNEYLHSPYTTATTVMLVNTVSPRLSGFVVDGASTGRGVAVRTGYNPIVSQVDVYNCSTIGIYYNLGMGGAISNCSSTFHRSASLGYGVLVENWSSCDIEGNVFIDGRAGVDLSGSMPTRYVRVRNNYGSYHTMRAFGSHASAQWCDFSGNHCAHNDAAGILARGVSHSIKNNTFVENQTRDIQVKFAAGDYIVSGNQGSTKRRDNLDSAFRTSRSIEMFFQESPDSVFISGNTFGFETTFVRVRNAGVNTGITIKNLAVVGNTAYRRAAGTGSFVSVEGDISVLEDFGMAANFGNPSTWFDNEATATLTDTARFGVSPDYPIV